VIATQRAPGAVPASPPRRRLASALDTAPTYQVIAFLALALIWEVGARNSTSILIPTFGETASALLNLIRDPEFWQAFIASNQALVIGFALSLVIGIPVGLAMGRFPGVERFSDFYLTILLVTPMAATIPLVIMATGLGLTSRVILVTFSSIVIVIVNTRAGVRHVDRTMIEMASSYLATERQIWRRVILPAAVGPILAGVRVGLSQAIGAMIIIELLMVAVGVGALIIEFRGRFLPEYLYATVLIVVLEALVLVRIVNAVEHRLTRWRRHG
jgi:NitT/TauT family transport system permease protein